MQVSPRPQFQNLVKILDAVNPFLVLFATIGIFFDYSPLKAYAALPNDIIAVAFALDFLLRLVAYPAARYFFQGWGWIDFLASLPGFLVLFSTTPLISLLRIVRIGRFFRIIRILRFLRAFSFLKSMRADSAWVQDRIMKIGVSVVLVFMVGIVTLDVSLRSGLETITRNFYLELQETSSTTALSARSEILYFSQGSTVFPGQLALSPESRDNQILAQGWVTARDSALNYFMEVPLRTGTFSPDGVMSLPTDGLLIDAYDILRTHEVVMTIVIASLLVVLLVIMFYMGAVFARDARTLQLVVDSYDAEDYFLLQEEATNRGFVDDQLLIDPSEDEMDNLLKVAVLGAEKLEAGSGNSMFDPFGNTNDQDQDLGTVVRKIEDLEYRLEGLLAEKSEALVKDTIQKLTPVLVRYMKNRK